MTTPTVGEFFIEWTSTATEDQMHITPVDDLVGHELDACVCGPYVEHLGDTEWLYAHYALDGRP